MTAPPTFPEGRAGQAFALALTGIVLAALWFGVASPLLDWYAGRAELVVQRRALAIQMEEQSASVPRLLRQAQAASTTTPNAAMLGGATDAVAGAALQERLQHMARHAGAMLTSLESTPAEAGGAWRRIGVRVTLTSSWPALLQLLQAIDAASPRLLVSDIAVQATPFVTPRTEQPLEVALTVLGFRPARVRPSTSVVQ